MINFSVILIQKYFVFNLFSFLFFRRAAALPITFRCMNEKLRIDPRITRFVLPIGCNINMDGTALFISVASIFIAQMSGMTLGFGELVTVLLTSTAASMSSASVPSAALVLLLVVLSAIDAPVQDVTLLFAIDWFVYVISSSYRFCLNRKSKCLIFVCCCHFSFK